ncbi:hypothetical protein PAMA_017504 [Pampus argenteus]
MGHGTPDNMNWAGLLQNLLVLVHLRQIMCDSVRFSIPEEQEPGILAGSLSKHFPPPYQLLTQEYLWMDKNTGNFYTTEKKMDREALCPEETKAQECIILHYAVVGPTGDLIVFPVIIEDINDNAPHFENSEIHLRVSEDVTVGTSFILDDRAQDRDTGRNGDVQYHLEGSDEVFSLKVEDGANQEPTIKIGFIAEHQNQTVVLPENQHPTALAVLEIEGDSSFEGSSLAIEGEVPFILSLQNGKYLLSTSKPLDYEMKSEHHIPVVLHTRSAKGSVMKPSRYVIRVFVADVNDNAPHFLQSHYQLEVEENNQPGMSLLQVSASDADSGYNGRVTYRLDKHASTIFNIDHVTGQLSVSASLDREQQYVHRLTVIARDSGSPALESVATVTINVVDQNDNAPVFLTQHFIFFIPENVAQFAQVGKVGVMDPDEGKNGNTEVHVVNKSEHFVVDNTQGTLRTTTNLDRETEDRYELYLLASDHGHPVSLTSTARVTIFVEDINDNQPKVILPSSNVSCMTVSPETTAGTMITKIYAIDEDSGQNSEITYNVVVREPTHNSSPFRVDSRSGNITLAQRLVGNDLGMHHLFIVVSDGGKPAPLHTTLWINLLVNESMEPCHLDSAPTWTGPSDFLVKTNTKAPICEVEEGATWSARLILLVGLAMMLASICLLVVTSVLYLKQRRRPQQKNEISLRLKDKYYSDD